MTPNTWNGNAKHAQRFTVIARDLLTGNPTPRADYSVAGLRQRHADLLVLDIKRVTIVNICSAAGRQCTRLPVQLVDRLILVSAAVTKDVNIVRLASLLHGQRSYGLATAAAGAAGSGRWRIVVRPSVTPQPALRPAAF